MTNKELFLPENYQKREKPEYFNDVTGRLYQPDVYHFANHLASGFESSLILDIGCGNGTRISEISNIKTIGFDYGNNLISAKNKYPDKEWIELNLDNSILHLTDKATNSFVICSDVIEHLVNPMHLIEYFRAILPSIYGIVISTPDRDRARGIGHLGPPNNVSHVAEWSLNEFNDFLSANGLKPLLHGFTRNVDNSVTRDTQIAFIPGGLLKPVKDITVLAVIPCFNEIDVIKHTIDRLIAQGVSVHVLDNWSNDGTWELLQQYSGITIERFPSSPINDYNWTEILNRMDNIAAFSNYDWIMHVDADEQIESPIEDISVKEFLSIADNNGFEIIDLTHVAFRPIESNPQELSVYWQFSQFPADRNINRVWKNKKETIGLSRHGGHILSGKKFPIKLILKHYPLRSVQQAQKKIFQERLPRVEKERAKGWHVHYDSYKQTHKFVWNKDELNIWDSHSIREWVVELTTKVNLSFTNSNLPKGFS